MDMNDLITAFDAIVARPDGPLSDAKIGAHFAGPSLNDPMVHSTNDVADMIEVNDSCLLGTIRICFVSSRLAVTTLPLYQAHADRNVGREETCEISDSGFDSHCPLSENRITGEELL
jgi:hypothetical protein